MALGMCSFLTSRCVGICVPAMDVNLREGPSVAAFIHPHTEVAADPVHTSPTLPMNGAHMAASGADAPETRVALAFSFGVSHLLG